MVRDNGAVDVRYVCRNCGYVIPENWSGKDRGMVNREVSCDGQEHHDWVADPDKVMDT